MERKQYQRLAEAHAPRSPVFQNCSHAFVVGGGICVVAQLIKTLGTECLKRSEEDAATLASVTLILAAALLSGMGVFDRIAKYAGAGTIVPITGFANSVVSCAIDCRAEGLILGVGAKIFTVAGPVLLYGTLAGSVYGVLLWIFGSI